MKRMYIDPYVICTYKYTNIYKYTDESKILILVYDYHVSIIVNTRVCVLTGTTF